MLLQLLPTSFLLAYFICLLISILLYTQHNISIGVLIVIQLLLVASKAIK